MSSEDSSHDFSSDDSVQDPNYEPSSELESTYANSSIGSESEIDINIAYDGGRSRDISLKRILKSNKSRPKLWENFGVLQYKGKTISKVEDKIYCQICFKDGCLKR